MTDLLPASFAALGAVVGLIVGAVVASSLWYIVVPNDYSDVPPMVVGGLAAAVVFAWLGLRLSARYLAKSS